MNKKVKIYRAYCDHCNTVLAPTFLEKKKYLPEDVPELSIIDLVDKWDELSFAISQLDLVCNFFLLQKDFHPGRSKQSFLLPTEHVS